MRRLEYRGIRGSEGIGVSRLECRGMGEGGSRGSEQAGGKGDGRRSEQEE